MTTFEQAWQLASSIEGWLTEGQGRALFEAGGQLAPGTVAVEIGSHRGKSAVLIALGLPSNGRLLAVDPFDDPRWGGGAESLEMFRTALEVAGVTDRVDLYRGLSEEASATWNGPLVGFLWVDGAHDRISTLKDFDGWMPHMASGGLIYVHDAFSAVGTTRAVLERFLFSRHVVYEGCERTMVKFRVGTASPMVRLLSALRLLRRLGFFSRMVAIKVARRRGLHAWERRFMRVENEPLI
ncbi:MAG: class I SAM-dependent methyltransferase [Actinomycetota bacterium]